MKRLRAIRETQAGTPDNHITLEQTNSIGQTSNGCPKALHPIGRVGQRLHAGLKARIGYAG